jgi:hypothetical protein
MPMPTQGRSAPERIRTSDLRSVARAATPAACREVGRTALASAFGWRPSGRDRARVGHSHSHFHSHGRDEGRSPCPPLPALRRRLKRIRARAERHVPILACLPVDEQPPLKVAASGKVNRANRDHERNRDMRQPRLDAVVSSEAGGRTQGTRSRRLASRRHRFRFSRAGR